MTATGGFAIVVDGATKRYGRTVAADAVGFRVEPGSTTALVGPNGAGKTTLLDAVLGRLALDAGSARVVPAVPAEPTRPPVLGAVLEGVVPEPYVSVGELVRWRQALLGASESAGSAALVRAAPTVDARRRFGQLSRGQRQLALWAAALVGPPDVLVLDEPLAHLDPLQRAACQALVAQERDRGAAVLLSTHVLADVGAAWVDRALVVVGGRLVAECGPDADVGALLAAHVGSGGTR